MLFGIEDTLATKENEYTMTLWRSPRLNDDIRGVNAAVKGKLLSAVKIIGQ